MVVGRHRNCPMWLAVVHCCTLRRSDSRRWARSGDDRNWDKPWVDSRRFGRVASSTYPGDVAGRESSRWRAGMWDNAFGGWDGRRGDRADRAEEGRERSDRLVVVGDLIESEIQFKKKQQSKIIVFSLSNIYLLIVLQHPHCLVDR